MRMRWRRPTLGSVQPDTWAIANPAESAFCAPYGLVDPCLLRIAVPTVTQIEIRPSSDIYHCGRYTEVSSLLADASRQKIKDEESKRGLPPGPMKHIYFSFPWVRKSPPISHIRIAPRTSGSKSMRWCNRQSTSYFTTTISPVSRRHLPCKARTITLEQCKRLRIPY